MPVDVKVTKDGLKQALAAMARLTDLEVLVGVPAAEAPRKGAPATNALIGYVMEFGSPVHNIPARPTLIPGMMDAMPQIIPRMHAAAVAALNGDADAIDRGLTAVGLLASSAVKARIRSNTPPPLKPATLAARRRRGHQGTNTLVETGQFRNSITYVIRPRGTP